MQRARGRAGDSGCSAIADRESSAVRCLKLAAWMASAQIAQPLATWTAVYSTQEFLSAQQLEQGERGSVFTRLRAAQGRLQVGQHAGRSCDPGVEAR